jgi:hypothetical protein
MTSTNILHECQALKARPTPKCKLCQSALLANFQDENAGSIDKLLELATKEVEEGYFKILRDQQPKHYRERAYCYELYHQMRCLWPQYGHPDLLINGELDKRGNDLFKNPRVNGAKPDFLVHKPGTMDSNHTIIEVKTVRSYDRAQVHPNDWCDDLDTLDAFIKKAGYRFAIFLLVGDEQEDLILRNFVKALKEYPAHQKEVRDKKIAKLKEDKPNVLNPESKVPESVHPKSWCREIQIWHHAKANEPAKKIRTFGKLLEQIGTF